MNHHYSRSAETSTEAPGLFRNFVRTKLLSWGILGEIAEDLALAVYEVVANVIEHACGGAEGKEIRLEINVEKEGIEVLILDSGSAFAVKSEPLDIERLITEKSSGGLGLALIRSLVDELTYQRHDDHNVARLFIKTR